MPVLTASIRMSEATASICATMMSTGSEKAAVTPVVFCAVMAAIALTPHTPFAANVFRSAWIPAPPPESDLAIARDVHTLRSAHDFSWPSQVGHRANQLLVVCPHGRNGGRLACALRAASVVFIAVLTAAAAQVSVSLPFTPVPLTLQPMVVLLGGAVLGSRLGFASQVAYLAAGIVGLPVFAASPLLPPGAARLLGPTGGFLMSYPVAAFVAGWLAQRGFDRHYLTSVACWQPDW